MSVQDRVAKIERGKSHGSERERACRIVRERFRDVALRPLFPENTKKLRDDICREIMENGEVIDRSKNEAQ